MTTGDGGRATARDGPDVGVAADESTSDGESATASHADPGTRPPAVAVDGVTKRFGSDEARVTAVDDVSFEIDAGSVVGLLGPNGAGKTTLIKSILGMVLPDAGRVRVCGHDVRTEPRAAYAAVDAMLEGARNDYWRLTVRENLRYFATVGGVDPDSVTERHDRLLDRLDLTEKADVAVRKLSRGMKQKVSLASVLASGAEVVFLDEPTLGLDVESSRTLQRELRRLAEQEGLTVVLSSHDMDVVETVCDRVLIMADGRIVADDAVDALLRGDDRHRLRLTSRDFDAALLSRLRETGTVTDIDRRARGTRIEVAADSDGLYALMARLRDRGVTLDEVTTVDRDLEGVFVALTDTDAASPDSEPPGRIADGEGGR